MKNKLSFFQPKERNFREAKLVTPWITFLVQHALNTSMARREGRLSNLKTQNAFGCLKLMAVRQKRLLKRKEKTMLIFVQVASNCFIARKKYYYYNEFYYLPLVVFAFSDRSSQFDFLHN